ncbi:MAG: PstS family phosphate ABC transporter substrate-binding protein, partial [Armatimonadetes bacterium]|nr:PstS family phosphate ABC transporter substrate-binding protein [Armatimonadota bacterium]
VFPITEAVAEEFQKLNPSVKVTVGISGTGGGFKKFAIGETDIQNASRPIKDSEAEAAAAGGIEFVEIPVAFDGLSIVVNPQNTWASSLTVAELKKIWEPGSKINNWSQVRPGFPNKPIKLYGAGTDSGTFDYFTEAICGKEGASRPDYQASEDDNTLVTGVAGDPSALGYFGFAYYSENKDKLKLVGIDNGNGPVLPNEATINDGTYAPLARPLFLYVAMKSAERPEVKAFVEFYLSATGRQLVAEVGYVPLPDAAYELALKRFHEGKTGSLFSGGSQIGVKIEDLLKR